MSSFDTAANIAALEAEVRSLRAELRRLWTHVGRMRRYGQVPPRYAQVLGVLRRGPLTVDQIAQRLGTTQSYARRLIAKLRAEGTVVPDGVWTPPAGERPRVGVQPILYRLGS